MKKLLVMLLLLASSAQGEIYFWKDSRGTAHYTNSTYEIPARYRARAKVLDLGLGQKEDAPPSQPHGSVPVAAETGSHLQSPTAATLPVAVPELRPQREERRRGERRSRSRGTADEE